MSITDELREYARIHQPYKSELYNAQCADEITAIADRIDAEHDKALNSVDGAYDSGYNVGYDEGFASADDWLAQHEDAMAQHGWIRLPKDADGVPIRFGDKVTVPWRDKVYEVRGFSYTEQLVGGQRTVWVDVYSRVKMGNVPLCGVSSCRHYRAPTVEDVLREFADGWDFAEGAGKGESYMKTFAAKLRLAEEDA